MSRRSIAEESIVFNAGQPGFEVAEAAARLGEGQLVVLLAGAVKPALAEQRWLLGLSAAEMRRFHSYKSRTAATQFLQGRSLLRNLLVSYMDVGAGQIEVSCEEHIKPVASCPAADSPVPQFSLSHSGAWIVLGAHRDRPLGIDIECAGPQEIDALATMPDLFTRNERAYLALCLDHKARTDLFLQLWRCKEAVMKATGRGFSLAPTSFDVLTPEGSFITMVDADAKHWNLKQVNLRDGLDCAIALGDL